MADGNVAIDDAFLANWTAPRNLEEIQRQVHDFVALHTSQGRPIVCVTSGGTTVPLEKNAVRFLDNFSAGTRGAASAEEFLAHGYAVLFLHRKYSLAPFSRHYASSMHLFMDYLTVNKDGNIEVHGPESKSDLIKRMEQYQIVKRDSMLLKVEFVTVYEYLFFLKAVSVELNKLGSSAMMYLAAAVSDFLVEPTKMVEHKIQSSDGPLVMSLDHTPKVLGVLRSRWCPNAYVVSFKLETDQQILIKKAKQAISKYSVHCVVANLLQTRKDHVILVDDQSEIHVRRSSIMIEQDVDIEKQLITELVQRHRSFKSNPTSPSILSAD